MPPVYVVTVRRGAGFPVLAPAGIRILAALDAVAVANSISLEITSGSEAMGRDPKDPHPCGEAVDVSVRNLTPGQIVRLRADLQARLGAAFTVLYEVPTVPLDSVLVPVAYVNKKATGSHFHIQRKKNTVFPPADPPQETIPA